MSVATLVTEDLVREPVDAHLRYALSLLLKPRVHSFLLQPSPDPVADAETLVHPAHCAQAYALALHRVVWGVNDLESECRASWLYTPAWADGSVIVGIAVRHDTSRAAPRLAAKLPAYPSGFRMMRFAIDLPSGHLLVVSSPCPRGTVEIQYIALSKACRRLSIVAILRAYELTAATANSRFDNALLHKANLFALTLRVEKFCHHCSQNRSCYPTPRAPTHKLDFSGFRAALSGARGIHTVSGNTEVVVHVGSNRVQSGQIRVQLAILELQHAHSINALRKWGSRSRLSRVGGGASGAGPSSNPMPRRPINEPALAAPIAATAEQPFVTLDVSCTVPQRSIASVTENATANVPANVTATTATMITDTANFGAAMPHPVSSPHERSSNPPLLRSSTTDAPPMQLSLSNPPQAMQSHPRLLTSTIDATAYSTQIPSASASCTRARIRPRSRGPLSSVPAGPPLSVANQANGGRITRIVKNPFAPEPMQSTYVTARDKRLEERRERNRRSAARSNELRKQARLTLQRDLERLRERERKLRERKEKLEGENCELQMRLVTIL